MATTKWGFTDDMAFVSVGSTTIAALMGFRARPSRDDSEVHVCGDNKPWKVVPGKYHYLIEYEGIMLDKETYWDRYEGSTNAFSGGVAYPQYATVTAKVQNPYVGSSTAHYKQYVFSECLLNEPEWETATGDGIIIQQSTAMCKSVTVTEQEPAD